jgi:hypothetical protein
MVLNYLEFAFELYLSIDDSDNYSREETIYGNTVLTFDFIGEFLLGFKDF